MDLTARTTLVEDAARVVHDIYSAIATMEMSLYMLSQEVENENIGILRTAIHNIRERSSNLLNKYRSNSNQQWELKASNDVPKILISRLLEEVVSQKRLEWLNRPHDLILTISSDAQLHELTAPQIELKFIVSNLLNNAIEASKEFAKINVNLAMIDTHILIEISDRGSGMPQTELNKYIAGASSKHRGKGLGLSSAYDYMKKIGGEISISSKVGQGTTVSLIL